MRVSKLYFSVITFSSLFNSANAAFRIELASVIEVIGNKFFNTSSGNQFFIRGIAYQRTRKPGEIYDAETETAYVDSLANPSLCLKDLEFLKELGVNTVRVYQVDPTKNHDVCMNAFASHGIYLLVDLSEPQKSIKQGLPSWDVDLMKRYADVVDSMHGYTNVLGFIAGNEVLNKVENSDAAAFVKASVRDVKAFIRKKNYRRIPIGYASADDTITRLDSANYFVCKDDNTESAAVDFYALNMFEWCGYSSYGTLGYKERTNEFSRLSVPVFFSEYGCNAIRPRPFTEIDLIYGPTMSQVWSGALLYEFFQNENRYGLVDENAVGHIIKLEEFNIVKLRLVESVPRGVHRDTAPPAYLVDRSCPKLSASWNALHVLPPTPDTGLCECLQASLTCVVTPYTSVNEHELLREVCAKTDCLEVQADGSKGVYGRFSGCSIKQRVSYALNKHYTERHKNSGACDFGKRAALTTMFATLTFKKPYMPDGRTCDEILQSSKPLPSTPATPSTPKKEDVAKISDGESSVVEAEDGEMDGPRHLMSAAQKPGNWGLVVVFVFVVSFMYLAT